PVSQGGFGVVPWGGASQFIDPTATWLWTQTNARFSAPAGTVDFSTLITNSSQQDKQALIHMLVDNDADVFLNDAKVGSGSMGFSVREYAKIPIALPWGTSTLRFRCVNSGTGPAGLLVAVVDAASGVTIVKSDPSSWVFNV
ncbi:hypothetical protein JKP88DRAFT_136668, partial [Tribonema minus]